MARGVCDLELTTVQCINLSEEIIGIVCQRSRTITLNTHYKDMKTKRSEYYIALLENALMKGYDCILVLVGTDVISKISVAI